MAEPSNGVTRVIKTAVAATKTYDYTGINLLPEETATLNQQMFCYITPASTGIERLMVENTDFTFGTLPTQNITLIGDTATNLADGDLITMRRITKRDARYTDFTGLGFLRSDDIDVNGDQLLYIIQENTTEVQDALIKTSDQTKWQGEGLPSTNCGNAIDSTGWTTLGQVISLISGADPLDIGDTIYDEQNGTGSKTIFDLTTFPTTDVDAEKLFVSIDGVVQRPTADYSYTLVDGTPTVTFTTAPPNGTDNVQFRILTGVVATTYDGSSLDGSVIVDNTLSGASIIDGTLDGDALIDSSLPITKLEFEDTAEDNRFIVVDDTETPTLQQISFDNITKSGNSMPDAFTTTNVTVGGSAPPQDLGTWTWTNTTGATAFVSIVTEAQNGSGTISVDGVQVSRIGFTGGAVSYQTNNFFVPAGGVVTTTASAGGTRRVVLFSYQEV